MSEAEKSSSLRIGLNMDGDVVLMIGSERDVFTESGIDSLIQTLNTAKADSKDIKAALKKIQGVRKQYNTVGKPANSDLKIRDGGEEEKEKRTEG